MSTGASAPEGDGAGHEPIDPGLAEEVESAFDGVDLGAAQAAGAPGQTAQAGPDAQAPQGSEAPGDESDPLAAAQAENARLTDELARARADLYNLQQEYQGFVRRSRESVAGHQEAGAAGEAFDPTIHEALMAVESTEVTEPTIALVLQPGYRLGERVVRPARVQVSNPA